MNHLVNLLLPDVHIDNEIVNAYWEFKMPLEEKGKYDTNPEEQKRFIRNKYIKGMWTPKGVKDPVGEYIAGENQSVTSGSESVCSVCSVCSVSSESPECSDREKGESSSPLSDWAVQAESPVEGKEREGIIISPGVLDMGVVSTTSSTTCQPPTPLISFEENCHGGAFRETHNINHIHIGQGILLPIKGLFEGGQGGEGEEIKEGWGEFQGVVDIQRVQEENMNNMDNMNNMNNNNNMKSSNMKNSTKDILKLYKDSSPEEMAKEIQNSKYMAMNSMAKGFGDPYYPIPNYGVPMSQPNPRNVYNIYNQYNVKITQQHKSPQLATSPKIKLPTSTSSNYNTKKERIPGGNKEKVFNDVMPEDW